MISSFRTRQAWSFAGGPRSPWRVIFIKPRIPAFQFSRYRGFGSFLRINLSNWLCSAIRKLRLRGEVGLPISGFNHFKLSGSYLPGPLWEGGEALGAILMKPEFPSSWFRGFVVSWFHGCTVSRFEAFGKLTRTVSSFSRVRQFNKSGLPELPVYRFRVLVVSSFRISYVRSPSGPRKSRR